MKWPAETHGVHFELVRHFLRGMFAGEWSGSRDQWKSAAVGLVSLLLPAGLLLVREGAFDPRYASKYRLLAAAGNTEAIRSAALADEIALITLLMCVTGLIALFEWQALFPGKRDYLALASLPVRPREVFAARFLSVMLFSSAVVTALNLLPSAIAPMEFGGGWEIGPDYFSAALAQAAASGLACACTFFTVLAVQGALLNVVPPARFARASATVQGALTGVFMLGGLLSWSIKEWKPETIARLPEFGAWLPPAWFAGFHETLMGSRDAFCVWASGTAQLATGSAVAAALLAYAVSYRRYRKLMLETPDRLTGMRIGSWRFTSLLARTPRQQAAMDFMRKTLARSRTHRLLWLVYIGGAAAVVLNSSFVDGAIFLHSKRWDKALQFLVLFWPLACSVVMISGFRHLMSVPAELCANWIFQISEAEGRSEWMRAAEKFVIAYTIAPLYLLLFPVSVSVLGWLLALRMTVLQVLISLSIFELLFYSWQKLPFTCSYLPSQRPIVAVAGTYFAVLCVVVPILAVIVAASSTIIYVYPIYFINFAGHWVWLRRRRLEGWGQAKLLYEDLPATVVSLGIGEVSYAGSQAQLGRIAAREHTA